MLCVNATTHQQPSEKEALAMVRASIIRSILTCSTQASSLALVPGEIARALATAATADDGVTAPSVTSSTSSNASSASSDVDITYACAVC
jgi:hypothetical protein